VAAGCSLSMSGPWIFAGGVGEEGEGGGVVWRGVGGGKRARSRRILEHTRFFFRPSYPRFLFHASNLFKSQTALRISGTRQ
jgi:hypothetical protein